MSQPMSERLPNIHPGEVLQEEFLGPLAISQNRLARDIGVPPRRVNEVIHGDRAVTADTALRLARYFGTPAAFWMGLQADYDLEEARLSLGPRLDTEVTPLAATAGSDGECDRVGELADGDRD
jgi:addiction module HigA family antidote